MEKRQYRFAFDIGIGSCGWAVVSENETGNRRIEDAGSRIFDSGEMKEGKDRKSQERKRNYFRCSSTPAITAAIRISMT